MNLQHHSYRPAVAVRSHRVYRLACRPPMLSSEITKSILAQVQLALKPLGFRKSASTFTRDAGDVLQIVNVQKSTASHATRVKVTVNLGLWLKQLAPLRAGVPDKGNIWSAHWRARIGDLSSDSTDLWWEAGTQAEGEEVGRELISRILHALPDMEALSSAEALRQLWQTGRSPGLTDLERQRSLKLIGDRETSERSAGP